jgi:hypothetical protein
VNPSARPDQLSGRRCRWQVIAVVFSALVAGGCSAAGSAPAPPASRDPAAGPGTPAASNHPRRGPGSADFSISGAVPVQPGPSQDTHAHNPGTACQPGKFRRDQALGQATAAGFALAGAPVSATLLAHFLAGTGTAMHFGAGSQISREARVSSAFQGLNRHIQAAVLSQLRAGRSNVQLTGPELRTIRFALPASSQDLYLGFRGTQGLDVRGTGTMTDRGYTGSLTYVIRDSYGFPPRDQLLGFGPAMRYLQVNCGNPPTPGGARWFPDSIAVTMPFRHQRDESRPQGAQATPP